MDKERILSKIDELDTYLRELETIKLSNFIEYKDSIENKRACERLLQISIETVIDICNILISNLKLGLPSDEGDMFKKLERKNIITKKTGKILANMKGFRNILVHRYGVVDDALVFEMLSERLDDFEKFRKEILKIINS